MSEADINRETLERIWHHWSLKQDGSQRIGQALMNAIWTVNPDDYTALFAKKEDCFYDDSKIVYTLQYLQEKYGDK
jgi:hypothetical protein